MASSWGTSWATSWLTSWGGAAVTPTVHAPIAGAGSGKYRRHEDHEIVAWLHSLFPKRAAKLTKSDTVASIEPKRIARQLSAIPEPELDFAVSDLGYLSSVADMYEQFIAAQEALTLHKRNEDKRRIAEYFRRDAEQKARERIAAYMRWRADEEQALLMILMEA